MVWDSTLMLAVVLAAMLLVLGREIVALQKVTGDLRSLRKKLEHKVDDVDRLAGELQRRVGGPVRTDADSGGDDEAEAAPDRSKELVSEVENSSSPSTQSDVADDTPPAPSGGQPQPTPSAQAYRELYRRWCVDGVRPEGAGSTEVVMLRYDSTDGAGELSQKTYLFRDDTQGQLVRFSPAGAEYGQAFPNPQSFFNDSVHRLAFPKLTAETFKNRPQLALIDPVRVQRRPDGKWQIVS